MFYALAAGKIETASLEFRHVLQDIETLNRWAMEGRLEVTALSAHAYAYVASRYILLPYGGSVGDRYGPIVVAPRALSHEELLRTRIAVPGTLTTAYLALRLYLGDFPSTVVPFDQIFSALEKGECGAGLLIHEGQLTYASHGYIKVVDLGEWWHETTGLPLPLGVNVVRRDLGPETVQRISRAVRESIAYALAHRPAALEYALKYGRGLSSPLADRFVGMYVNAYSLDYGPDGREGLARLLALGAERKVLPESVPLEFVGE